MIAKLSLTLALVVSLLCLTQAQPVAELVALTAGGACPATTPCVRGCCADAACCTLSDQPPVPVNPVPASQQPFHVQLAALGLRAYVILPSPPARVRPLVMLDETRITPSLSPLAAGCIQLI